MLALLLLLGRRLVRTDWEGRHSNQIVGFLRDSGFDVHCSSSPTCLQPEQQVLPPCRIFSMIKLFLLFSFPTIFRPTPRNSTPIRKITVAQHTIYFSSRQRRRLSILNVQSLPSTIIKFQMSSNQTKSNKIKGASDN